MYYMANISDVFAIYWWRIFAVFITGGASPLCKFELLQHSGAESQVFAKRKYLFLEQISWLSAAESQVLRKENIYFFSTFPAGRQGRFSPGDEIEIDHHGRGKMRQKRPDDKEGA